MLSTSSCRHLLLVLGDQLSDSLAVFDDFDHEKDALWMAETEEEATHVWCHKLRLAYFFSAMRHFRDEQRGKGCTLHYHELTTRRSDDRGKNFAEILARDVRKLRPEKLILTEPGDYRVLQMLQKAAKDLDTELEVRPDTSFYCSIDEFKEYAGNRKSLLLETFYRHMRKKHDVMLTERGDPVGGDWNYDKENRESFGSSGPPRVKTPRSFSPDDLSQAVCEMVEKRFKDHPGTTEHFDLAVTRSQARAALRDFVENRLPHFGTHQDAMWTDEHFHAHSRLSCLLNVRLLDPRECVDAAVAALEKKQAPLNAVEGFVRQIIGWREFVRGVYWLKMPDYTEKNELNHTHDLPSLFWDGDTDMECVRQSMQNVLRHGYAHHIQRLMVLGEFALLYGADPLQFHEWHMAMYLDAIDWVSAPNTIGMSQYADGGIVGTKPYCASGNYINKMSNYCKHCRYNYKKASGEDACPVTVFYWDFLDRHHGKFRNNQRMAFQVKNIERKQKTDEMTAIRRRARELREAMGGGG